MHNKRKKVLMAGYLQDKKQEKREAIVESSKKVAKKAAHELFYFSIIRTLFDIVLFLLAVVGVIALLYQPSRVILSDLIQQSIQQIMQIINGG